MTDHDCDDITRMEGGLGLGMSFYCGYVKGKGHPDVPVGRVS